MANVKSINQTPNMEVKKSNDKKVKKTLNVKALLEKFQNKNEDDAKITLVSDMIVQEAEQRLMNMIQTRAALALFAAGVIDENGEEVPEVPKRPVGRPKGSGKKDNGPPKRKYGKRGRPTKAEIAAKDQEEAEELKRIAAANGEALNEEELPLVKRAKIAEETEKTAVSKAEAKKAEAERKVKAFVGNSGHRYLTRKRLGSL